MGRYVHILINNGRFQSRVMKQSRTALESGLFDEVHIVAKKRSDDAALPDFETLAPGITLERVPVPTVLRGFNTLWWMVRMARRGIAARGAVTSVHHVMLLPVGVIVKLFSRTRLVYDAHELETESASMVGEPRKRRLLKAVEWALMRFADHAVVVSEPIRDWYRARSRVPVTAIHNYPRSASLAKESNQLRSLHRVPDDKTLFIYQGAIQANRGVPLLLDVFGRGMVPGGVLVLMGYGGMVEEVQRVAKASPHVRYQPAVSQDQIIPHTASADVGLCVFEASCQSYALAMPNKLFEYVQAGLPVVVANPLAAMAGMVRKTGIGLSTDLTPEALAKTLNEMVRKDRSEMRRAVMKTRKACTWENEERRLIEVYSGLVA